MAIRLSISAIRQDPKLLLTGKTSTTGSVIYHTVRTDRRERWKKMSSQIDSNAQNAVDIGCNRGGVTRQSARGGLFSIGIDVEQQNVNMARKLTEVPHCHFMCQEMTPENAGTLPKFDVGFVLAVFYHWGDQFGWDKAESMLQQVSDSTDQLFIETECGFNKIKSKKLDTSGQPEQALVRYFEEILPEKEISVVGKTEWVAESSRTDIIFEAK